MIKNEEIIYIGKSSNLITRIQSHKQDKDFDKVEIINFENKVIMDMGEIYFIFKFKPKFNKEFNYDEGFCPSIAYFDDKNWIELNSFLKNKNLMISNEKYSEIKYCFVRKRNEKYYVYVEFFNKKQKMIFNSINKDECEIICKKIKNIIKT